MIVGFFIGILGGITGSALGAFRLTAMLPLISDPVRLASTSLTLNTLVALVTTTEFIRLKRVRYRLFFFVGTFTWAGALAGSMTSRFIPRETLYFILGSMLCISGSMMIYSLLRARYGAKHLSSDNARLRDEQDELTVTAATSCLEGKKVEGPNALSLNPMGGIARVRADGEKVEAKQVASVFTTNSEGTRLTRRERVSPDKWWLYALAGVYCFVTTFLAATVGLILSELRLPVLMNLLRVPPREAAATNMAIGTVGGVIGSFGYIVVGSHDTTLIWSVGSVSIIGALIGVHLAGVIPAWRLRGIIAATVFIVGAVLLARSI